MIFVNQDFCGSNNNFLKLLFDNPTYLTKNISNKFFSEKKSLKGILLPNTLQNNF